MKLYPLKFKPIYKYRIWGSRKLGEVFGKELPPGQKIGESWELADLPEDKSIITNGPLKGQTIASALAKFPKKIIGDANYAPPFPLLIKILDCEDILSIQVHPDAETCSRTGKGDPKTECWYIIGAEPEAVIYKGLKPGVTKKDFAEAIKTASVAELLQKVPVKIGECHFLPAGTPHAIGPGLLIAEIQTPSDTTYRVFDWNRLDESGNFRPLHIDDALDSIHFDASGDELSVTTQGRLADCEYFKIDKFSCTKADEAALAAGQMQVVMILSGSGDITSEQIEAVGFSAGETILIPSDFQGSVRFNDDTEYLLITL